MNVLLAAVVVWCAVVVLASAAWGVRCRAIPAAVPLALFLCLSHGAVAVILTLANYTEEAS